MNQLNTQNNPTQLFYYLTCLRQSPVLISRPWRGEPNFTPNAPTKHTNGVVFYYHFFQKNRQLFKKKSKKMQNEPNFVLVQREMDKTTFLLRDFSCL